MRIRAVLVPFVLCAASACSSLTYDLSGVPVPISAQPAPAGAVTEPLHIEGKSVMWVHGLFGSDQPDVAALVREAAAGADGIANFRVKVSGGFHDWLLTHVTLTLVRMKTVVIEGDLVRTSSGG